MTATASEELEDLVAKLGSDLKIRVSTVLNRDVKEYGKKFMFDDREDTCWNSDQGQSQAISFQCECPVIVRQMHIQFQGGFAGKDCQIEMQSTEKDEVTQFNFYPEDINQMQIFEVTTTIPTKSFKINFLSSTDFFGRIIVYQLKLLGDII